MLSQAWVKQMGQGAYGGHHAGKTKIMLKSFSKLAGIHSLQPQASATVRSQPANMSTPPAMPR